MGSPMKDPLRKILAEFALDCVGNCHGSHTHDLTSVDFKGYVERIYKSFGFEVRDLL